MTLAQARKYALSLPGTREEPHFERTSFRVQGKIFATALPDDGYLNVFVGDEHREPALGTYPGCMDKVVWGGKVVGLRIDLARAPAAVVKELLKAGWESRAIKK
jgi:predicted DNA-binding protein (MmcQ/YjbR family)